ncbi:winged helix-turn-helix domain-containing protein [Sinomonas terrae]|uniref:Winged helix-turn-helix domain-containing protein n=1 Tax=Sinomonas terrae TaxID=2908838 RepID=A0ABS9U4Y8_9MICC|nr:winged helix-turn-helix domain-containing protein [Sinomonas terrae]MCH6471753.1 winged helix-turn-helix domain-containing protein [Sinomonas terrae]
MSVASGYVHISVRNAQRAQAAAGRQPFGGRSTAQQEPYGAARPLRPVADDYSPMTAPTPVVAPGTEPVRSVSADTVAHGFVLYVGISEEQAAAAGSSIARIAQEIRAYAQNLVPGVESYAAVAVAPSGAQGSPLDVVRSTFGDPTIGSRPRPEPRVAQQNESRPSGVLIDLARREVHLDGDSLNLTFKEFELLNYLVENGTRTVSRDELLENLWKNAEEIPNERTIDVHIRRLRSKLGRLANTVRTVRGQGYRFYEHPEVIVWAAPEYSI